MTQPGRPATQGVAEKDSRTSAETTRDAVGAIAETLRARGMRMTPQRERVLAAVGALGHATPDAVADAIDTDGGPPLSLSTIYRNLEALERVGAVSHTHLEPRAPSYHLATHTNHLHLVCLGCGAVGEAPVRVADAFATTVLQETRFVVDVRHMAVHGWCGTCEREES